MKRPKEHFNAANQSFAAQKGLTVGLALAGMMSPLLATVMMPTSAILTLFHVTAQLRKA